MKFCNTCKSEKSASEFHHCKSHADGLASLCKSCKKVKAREYYEKTRPHHLKKMAAYRKAKPKEISEAKKRCYQAKKSQYKETGKKRYEEKREEILAQAVEYRNKNKERINSRNVKYVRRRMSHDQVFKLSYVIRCRLGQAFRKRNVPKRGKTRDMLGCDWEELKTYIENKFLPGMTWENRGAWHIDHVIPLASAKTVDEMERLCHYTNLQPLWAVDNIRKGARIAA